MKKISFIICGLFSDLQSSGSSNSFNKNQAFMLAVYYNLTHVILK